METKLHGNEWDNMKNKLKMPQALLVDATARRGGLALLWNRDLEVEVLSFSSHHIEATIKEDGADPWRMVGFYGHHEVAKRKLSWSLLRFISNSSVLPTIFIGDFDEVFFHYEHVSQAHPRPNWQMNNFRQMAKDYGIIDVGFSGFPFTWCNNFTSPYSTRARLDRGLASKDWMHEFPNAQLIHLSSNTSDHLPLLLNKGTRRNGIKMANDEYWRQRSRVEWHVKADRNTAYFHALSVQKGRMSVITFLQDEYGTPYTNTEEIHKLAIDFYQDLFTSKSPPGSLNLYNLNTKRLFTIQRNNLDKEFLSSEVNSSIFSIKGKKHPDLMVCQIKDPVRMINFRPIALCNTMAKVIAKCLAIRLKNVLPTIISEYFCL
ncbi:hypothetical protein LIER_02859 [Lithospermum erythrorhizon]|uniref:Nucleotide-diphospho-sugar transferase domain-containing protein n=1 Tax=Lithospermum erythrorhizon TaxID=34254 RepID=A0AAV3NS68_LITER